MNVKYRLSNIVCNGLQLYLPVLFILESSSVDLYVCTPESSVFDLYMSIAGAVEAEK